MDVKGKGVVTDVLKSNNPRYGDTIVLALLSGEGGTVALQLEGAVDVQGGSMIEFTGTIKPTANWINNKLLFKGTLRKL